MKNILCLILLQFPLWLYAQGLDKTRVNVISRPDRTEFSPTISADGRTMIFETQRGTKKEDKWELYQSTLQANNEWSEPVALSSINDKCQFIAGPSLNYEGNVLYYTAYIEGVTTTEDIYYSVLEGRRWSEPIPLGAPVNTPELYEGFPSISADGQSLYFIRQNLEFQFDRKSKEQCFIIFLSRKQKNGTWGEPIPLPEPVNTGCERDPRIMADNHTLIFSSIRSEGQGKYDLYQTRLLANGQWEEPEPLDFVNSPESDQSPCISASGNRMYYYSDNDIYQLTIPPKHRQMINITVQGYLTGGTDRKPIKGIVTVRNLKSGESYFTQSNDYDGRYTIVLSAGQSYEVIFNNLKYRQEKVTFDFSNEEAYREERKDMHLSSVWPIPLVVNDKDLSKPVDALVTITRDDGKVMFSDSVDAASMPRMIELETDHQFTLTASSNDYVPFRQDLKFVQQLYKEGAPHAISLDHEMVAVTADVTVGVNGPRKRVKFTYKNESTGEVIVADAGEVTNLRKGDRYQVMTSSDKGFSYAMESFVAGADLPVGEEAAGSPDRPSPAFAISLPIVELKEGAILSLSHIYFESNAATLNQSSSTELEHIVDLLKNNPTVVIEISAHTDDVGSEAYNNNLSQQRAQSVTNFLVTKGISKDQLVPVGYGESKPIVPNDSEENRGRNRRVEMLVLKGGQGG